MVGLMHRKAVAKEEKVAKGKNRCDRAQVQGPQVGLGSHFVGCQMPQLQGQSQGQCVVMALAENVSNLPQIPWEGPLERIGAWQAVGADGVLLQAIKTGVNSPLFGVPGSNVPRRTPQEGKILETIGDYLDGGVL